MEFKTIEEYRGRYAQAPTQLQNFMSAQDTIRSISEITKKYNIEDIRSFSYLVGEVLLRIKSAEDFKNGLHTYLGVTKEDSASVTQEVSERLFLLPKQPSKDKPHSVQAAVVPEKQNGSVQYLQERGRYSALSLRASMEDRASADKIREWLNSDKSIRRVKSALIG